MNDATLKRNFIQRLLGICATREPADEDSWTLKDGCIILDLGLVPELSAPNGAVRLEKKKGLQERILLFHGNDGAFHAFTNRCSHAGRRLDPVPGRNQVQCCSIGKSTFDHTGRRVSGSAKSSISSRRVSLEGGKLIILLNE